MNKHEIETIIKQYEQGYSMQEIANLTKKPVALIQALIKQYNKHQHALESTKTALKPANTRNPNKISDQQQIDRNNPITRIQFSHKERQ